MTTMQVEALLRHAGSGDLRGFTGFREGSAEYLSLTCNGWGVHARYSPAEVVRLRRITSRLTL
jgi:hypothetical protein